MEASDVIRALTVASFAAVAVAAYRQYRRDGGIASQWILLGFALLTVVSAALALLPDQADAGWTQVLRRVVLSVLPLFPYCLFRFTTALTPAHRWLVWSATGLTAAVVVSPLAVEGVALADGPDPAWYTVALLGQWTVLSAIASMRLWRAGREEPTVARRRMQTLSWATIGLTVTLLLAGAAGTEAAAVMIRLLALTSALLFLVALAPPPLLRAAWRRPEEIRLRGAVAELMAATTAQEVIAALLPQVARLLGARSAALLAPDGTVLASHGASDTVDPDGHRRVELARLSSGRLSVITGPYTPLFGREEFELVRSLAEMAELAVERSREHRVAATLQQMLLPEELPSVSGLRVEARYQPGGSGAVGGDWYDLFPLSEGRVGLVIGDVMGHGVAAAALMAQLRSALRAYAVDGEPPSVVLGRLDRMMRHLGMSEIATVLYVVVDVRAATICFASAGHPPPLLHRHGEPASVVDGGLGPPLGIWEEAPDEASLALPPDATLVLYTDGLIERRGEDITEGLARLQKALAAAPGSPFGLCDYLLGELLPQGSGTDDVAILAIAPEGDRHAEPSPPTEATTLLTGEPSSAREARSFVTDMLTRWKMGDGTDTVQLLTSEVVTNAVVHARSAVRLSVRLVADSVRVTVSDNSSRLPTRLAADPLAENGRGLLLVDALSTRWAVEPHDQGKRIWFEVQVFPAETGARELRSAPG